MNSGKRDFRCPESFWPAAILLLLMAVSLIVAYRPAFDYPLIYDSRSLAERHPALATGAAPDVVLTTGFLQGMGFHIGKGAYYRPFAMFTFYLEKAVLGKIIPRWSRTINLIVFFIGLFLLFRWLSLITGATLIPALLVLLFSLHPAHSENIIWIVGRCDLLLLLFTAACLYFLERYARTGRRIDGTAALAAFVCGLLSKETMLILLPVIFWLPYRRRRRIPGTLISGAVFISLTFLAAKLVFIGRFSPPWQSALTPWAVLERMVSAAGYYLRCLLVPFDYPGFLAAGDLVTPLYLALGILAVGLFALLVLLFRSRPETWAPLWLIGGGLGIHIWLVISTSYPFVASSRYLILPMLGTVWLASLRRWKSNCAVQFGVAALVCVLALAAISDRRIVFRDETHFWRHLESHFPGNGYVLVRLAESEVNAGRVLDGELLSLRARQIPLDAPAAISLAMLQARIQYLRADFPVALSWLDTLANLNPFRQARLFHAHLEASILMSRGDIEAAERRLKTTLAEFSSPETALLLADLYRGWQQWPKLRALKRAQVERFPGLSGLEPAEEKKKFDNFTATRKLTFLIRYKNYVRALDIARSLPEDPRKDLLLVKLHFWSGQPDQANRMLEILRENYRDDPGALKWIGHTLLQDIYRVEEATRFFQDSLRADPEQSDLRRFLQLLSERYRARANTGHTIGESLQEVDS